MSRIVGRRKKCQTNHRRKARFCRRIGRISACQNAKSPPILQDRRAFRFSGRTRPSHPQRRLDGRRSRPVRPVPGGPVCWQPLCPGQHGPLACRRGSINGCRPLNSLPPMPVYQGQARGRPGRLIHVVVPRASTASFLPIFISDISVCIRIIGIRCQIGRPRQAKG